MDKRPQDRLTATQASGLSSKSSVKLVVIVNPVIGQPMVLEVSPDVLVGIELRTVGRKPLHTQATSMASEEDLHGLGSMGLAPIPQDDEVSPKMTQKPTEEKTGLRPTDAPIRREAEIGAHPPSVGGNAERRDRRNFLSMGPRLIKQGSPSPGSPGASDHGMQQEPALVKEDQVGVESMGFFLYGANPGSAIAGRPSRCARRPAAPASDNSSPNPAGSSRRDRGDTSPQSVCGSPAQFARTSIGPSKSRAPLALAITVSPTAVFAPPSTGEAVPRRAWLSTLPLRFGHTHAAIDEPIVGRPPPSGRHGWESARPPINLRLGGAAVPVPGVFRSVSYLIDRPLCYETLLIQ